MTQQTQRQNIEIADNKSVIREIFTFEWDNIFRIIGSITGLVGIIAAMLFLFGYARNIGILKSMGISDVYYASIPNERYFLSGLGTLTKFILSILLWVISYYVAYNILRTVGKDILKRIKSTPISLILGVGLGIIPIVIGINPRYGLIDSNYSNTIFLIFVGIDILKITFDVTYTKGNSEQKQSQYYGLINSTIGVIKTIIFISLVYILLFSQADIATKNGESYGCGLITKNPTLVTLYSDNPIGISGETIITGFYIYKGYFLSLSDNNDYYLFREVDPESLIPTSILIVKKDAVKAIEFKKVTTPKEWNLKKACSDLYKD